ncbi:MAG: winged helix-turn-helix domain-containing protein [Stenotrophomonas sp.]
MPRDHHDILDALPAERLRIGEAHVDAGIRQITRDDGHCTRVPLKAMDVLTTLALQPGKVFSRQELLETVWPDTLPGDEVLTQAIAQLRRALGDGKPASYIETIAKRGYRLLPSVQWLVEAGTDAADAASTAATDALRRRWPLLVAAVAGLSTLLLAAWWLGNSSPAPAQQPAALTYERLTSRPGSELWPALSPDGTLVAYSSFSRDEKTAALMLQTTGSMQPRTLTTAAPGERHTLPTWSPDGREIAYFRTLDGEQCRLMRIAASGGEPREIAACPARPQRFGWHPDGTRLLFGGPLLRTLELSSGTVQELAYARAPDDVDSQPAWSPDGRWIVFQRGISRADLWRVAATGGTPERLTRLETNLYGFAWTPDGKALVLSRFFDHGLRLSRLELADGSLTDLGVNDVAYPHIARNAATLTFIAGIATSSALYRVRLPAAGEATPTPPERVFTSTGNDTLPALSPDGRHLAFLSDRSGSTRLWWAARDRPESSQPVDGLAPLLRQVPAWSADGGHLLVVGTTAQGERLHEVALPSGRVSVLPAPAPLPTHAIALSQQRLLATLDHGQGVSAATLYDTAATPWRALARLEDVGFVFHDPARQRLLFTRRSSWGIWEAGMALDAPRLLDRMDGGGDIPGGLRPLLASSPYNQGRRVVAWPGGSAILGNDGECGLRWIALPRSTNVLAPCLDPRPGSLHGASVDPQRRELYYSFGSGHNEDIGWMPLPGGR